MANATVLETVDFKVPVGSSPTIRIEMKCYNSSIGRAPNL